MLRHSFTKVTGACTIAAHDWRDYGYYKRASKNIVVYWRFGLFSIRRASFVSEDQAREHTDLAEAQDFLNKKKIPDLSLVAVADGRASCKHVFIGTCAIASLFMDFRLKCPARSCRGVAPAAEGFVVQR